ncbi:MAG TPA: UDP-3-O-(3-hydroxymyristoyl)glucosamine N-acyltransferase [Steroidobacteraceae bacterium]
MLLGELAAKVGVELRGDARLAIERVGTLSGASAGAITFLANPQYRAQLALTRASAVVLDPASAAGCPVAALISTNPHATYARVATLLHPAAVMQPGVHPSAVIASGASIDPLAHVGALAYIAGGARIGARASVGPGSVVAEGVQVGADCSVGARVTLCRGVRLGERVVIHPGAVIGADGFGFARDAAGWLKVPQLGSVLIGDDVEIGANTTVDRGAIEDTVIETGAKLDNQIQIGHNVRIGAHTVIAGCTGVSGSTRIGQRCLIGGAVSIAGHLQICDDAVIAGHTAVTHDIRTPDLYIGVLSAEPARLWRRLAARFKRLDALARRVGRLERAAGGLEESAGEQDRSDE